MRPFGIFVLCLLATGCASSRRGGPAAPDVALRDAQERRGRLVFAENCHRCHPGGEAGVGPALNNKPIPAPLIRYQIRNGVGAMPGFDERVIDEKALDAVVAYLYALRKGG